MNIGVVFCLSMGGRGEGVGVAGEGLVAGDEIQAGSGRREQGMLCAYGTSAMRREVGRAGGPQPFPVLKAQDGHRRREFERQEEQ